MARTTLDDHAFQIAHRTSVAVLKRVHAGAETHDGTDPIVAASAVGDSVGFLELLIPLIPTFIQLLAYVFRTNCAKTTPGATPQSYLKSQQDANGNYSADFIASHRPNARRAIRINNRGRAPRDRIRPGQVSDDNLDEMTRQTFAQVMAQSPSAALAGYNAALAASQNLDMDV